MRKYDILGMKKAKLRDGTSREEAIDGDSNRQKASGKWGKEKRQAKGTRETFCIQPNASQVA
jgi:hypothetical protein